MRKIAIATTNLIAEGAAHSELAGMNCCFSGWIGMKQLQKYRIF
jgi:hypothetical protein